MGHREELIQRSIPFLQEVKDMTPSAAMEKWLNEKYGEGSDLYEDLARLIKLGVEEGWAGSRHYPEVKGGAPLSRCSIFPQDGSRTISKLRPRYRRLITRAGVSVGNLIRLAREAESRNVSVL